MTHRFFIIAACNSCGALQEHYVTMPENFSEDDMCKAVAGQAQACHECGDQKRTSPSRIVFLTEASTS